MNAPRQHDLFVSCAPALEPLLHRELQQLGFADAKAAYRGVYVPYRDVYDALFRINYCSRLATRVLLPLIRFRCQGRDDLYRIASAFAWEKYIPKGRTFAIDANVSHPSLRNALFAAQVVKDAICDQLRQTRGFRPSIDVAAPDVQLNLFIHGPSASLSIDSSCVALHKRGYRQFGGQAPLQEVLAAAALTLAGWHGQEPLCDLCCGTGTFLCEAALIATDTAPGFLRQRFGFMLFPGYSTEAWLKVKREIDAKRRPLAKGLLVGVDSDFQAIRACKANMRACGFGEQIAVYEKDLAEFVPAIAPRLVLANPPHGERLGKGQPLESTYRALGDWISTHTARPARAFILLSNLDLCSAIALPEVKRHRFISGGDSKTLIEYRLP